MSAALAPRKYGVLLLIFLVATIAERLTYGISDVRSFTRLLIAADSVPLHLRLSIRSFAKSMGVEAADEGATIDAEWSHLNYPRSELDLDTSASHPNIVWLTSESLRGDMLVPEIMPGTLDFAAQAHRFTQHYSGGKGTRMGMFSMFYGLYGSYWWPFLKERRGPVLFDVLHRLDYQFDLRTSARFTYPEFDMTLFASFQEDELHEARHGEGWERDRQNVDSLLGFLDRRDPARPFMAFQFFESPHANYYFPPESVIRPDYLPDLNYATMDVDRDMGQIKNRYINAVHHLDQQISRVLDGLRARDLLENTIVVITGDHGEEFMEKGRWGHNSAFTEEQTRVPLVLWIPGTGSSVVARMTSHLDLAPTILHALGVANPPEDYSLGMDLLGAAQRDFTVIAGWSSVCRVDRWRKETFGFSARSALSDHEPLRDKDDAVLEADPESGLPRSERLLELMVAAGRFAGGR